MRIFVAVSLGFFLASGTLAQCCMPMPYMAYQPQSRMGPVTTYQPVLSGYTPVMAIPQRVDYRTPLRDFLFGRYRYQYMPMPATPQSVGNHAHRNGQLMTK